GGPAKLAPPLTRFLVHENVSGIDRVRDIDGFGHGAQIFIGGHSCPLTCFSHWLLLSLPGGSALVNGRRVWRRTCRRTRRRWHQLVNRRVKILVSLVGGS